MITPDRSEPRWDQVARRWWEMLQNTRNGTPNPTRNPAALARLRRAATPVDALEEPSVFDLYKKLGFGRNEVYRRLPRVAAVAAVLAHIRTDAELDKRALSERDICTKFITPALRRAGWDEMLQIREEVSFTEGRIIVRGKLVSRGQAKRADYILYFKANIPLALIEAKDNSHSAMEAEFCVEVLEDALAKYGRPEIFTPIRARNFQVRPSPAC